MTKVKVTIEGQEVTVRAINMFDMETKQKIIKLVKETAKAVQKDARARAPVSRRKKSRGKSGDLRRSIRPKYFDGGLSATVVPRKPKGSHRHLVEYGTKSRYTKKGQYRGKMPKIPFMAPAEKAAEGQYNKKLKEIVDRDKVV